MLCMQLWLQFAGLSSFGTAHAVTYNGGHAGIIIMSLSSRPYHHVIVIMSLSSAHVVRQCSSSGTQCVSDIQVAFTAIICQMCDASPAMVST